MDGFRLCRVLDPGFDSQCTVADSLGLGISMDGFRLCRVLDPGFDSQCTVADSLGLGLSMDGRYDYCGFELLPHRLRRCVLIPTVLAS